MVKGQASRTRVLAEEYKLELVMGRNNTYSVQTFESQNLFIDKKAVIINGLNSVRKMGVVTIKGFFRFKQFASAGGLGSTRTLGRGRGVLEIEEARDQNGNRMACPPFCKSKIDLSIDAR